MQQWWSYLFCCYSTIKGHVYSTIQTPHASVQACGSHHHQSSPQQEDMEKIGFYSTQPSLLLCRQECFLTVTCVATYHICTHITVSIFFLCVFLACMIGIFVSNWWMSYLLLTPSLQEGEPEVISHYGLVPLAKQSASLGKVRNTLRPHSLWHSHAHTHLHLCTCVLP